MEIRDNDFEEMVLQSDRPVLVDLPRCGDAEFQHAGRVDAALDRFEKDQVVDEAALRQSRLVQGRDVRIKILGEGNLEKALTVSAHAFSKSAQEKIEKAGGKVVLIPTSAPAAAEG